MAYSTALAGSKLRAKLGTSVNESVAAPTCDFAQRQLEQMGWKDGQGLGKRKQGMVSHIAVTQRQDQVGLGASTTTTAAGQQQQQQWWKDSINDALAKLSNTSKDKKSKKKKKKRTRPKDYTDEELFEATGGARFGMRAQRRTTAKWARTESQTEEEERAAMERMEWNGRGNAQVKLKTQQTNVVVDASVDTNSSADTTDEVDDSNVEQRKDKKRKKSKTKSSRKESKSSKRSTKRGRREHIMTPEI